LGGEPNKTRKSEKEDLYEIKEDNVRGEGMSYWGGATLTSIGSKREFYCRGEEKDSSY